MECNRELQILQSQYWENETFSLSSLNYSNDVIVLSPFFLGRQKTKRESVVQKLAVCYPSFKEYKL